MRAALLPAGADPFVDAYWLRHYASIWADEVDELRVQVCGETTPEIITYLEGLVAGVPHATMTVSPRLDHGTAIGQLVRATSADHIMLCEDDAYVRRPGAVDAAFRRVESGETDIVACPRSSAVPEIIAAAAAAFGNDQLSSGEMGPLFWPCFLFVSHANLDRTDGNFSVRSWQAGEIIEPLGHVASEEVAADTFGSASLQLRGLGLRVHLEPEYRADRAQMADWAAAAQWFHVGSLSAGYGLAWLNGKTPEERQFFAEAQAGAADDWAKRIAWLRRLWTDWDGALPELHEVYGREMEAFVTAAAFDPAVIADWDAKLGLFA